MKIFLLSPGGIGGVNTQVNLLSKALTSRGIQTRIFFTTLYSGKNFLWTAMRLAFFIFSILTFRPDFCYIPLASKGSFYRKLAFAFISKVFRTPYFLHVHGGGFSDFYEGLAENRKKNAEWLFQSAHHIFVLHSGQIELCARILENSIKPKVSVLPNGIEIPGLNSKYVPPLDGQPIESIFIGDVTSRKGVDTLIQLNGFLQSRNVKIKFVGKIHEDISTIIAAKSDQELSQFTFFGPLPHPTTMTLLAQSHLLFLPSRVENFPNVILEAFSLGVPTLSSNVGALPELISTGKNGWLLKSSVVDMESVKLGIELALADKNRWEELSKSARLDAVSKFDIRTVSDELVRVLRGVLDE